MEALFIVLAVAALSVPTAVLLTRSLPAIAHVDGTARVQTVSSADEPWLHALLLAVGRRRGCQ